VRKAGKARTLWSYMPLLCPISHVTGHVRFRFYLALKRQLLEQIVKQTETTT
jgi:hypothetical protein